MMNSQRSDAENINFIQEGKKIGINEVIKRIKIINYSLKPCLRDILNERVQYAVVKNRDLLKIKKQNDY